MSDAGQIGTPSPKRRKLDNGSAAAKVEPVTIHNSPYLTLAQTSVQVELGCLEERTSDSEVPSDRPVSISSVEISDSGEKLEIRITAPWLKQHAILTTENEPVPKLILDNCTELDSTIKASKNSMKIPLACHDAKLNLDGDSARLTTQILWHDSSEIHHQINPTLRNMFAFYDPIPRNELTSSNHEQWDVREFYDNVHVPQSDEENNRHIQIDLLDCQLFPFQKRAVRWMLSREGVEVQDSGQIIAQDQLDKTNQLPIGFYENKDFNDHTYYANPSIGVNCSSLDEVRERYHSVKGGILAEAMGLGKTVEMIALMCLHKMENSPLQRSTSELTQSGATLIITPPAILEQWRQEIQKHAPTLRVHYYDGIKQSSKKTCNDWVEELSKQDVVLTTYPVVAKEIHYVMERPDRNLRSRPRFEPPKSPLDQILWWRVCLDEAQMVESGVSSAAAVARRIPRVNAWAVTGTPLKRSHKDLYGLMLFLCYEPWCHSAKLWEFLVLKHRPMFRHLMGEIAIRHSKEMVREELSIPPQNRHTITMGFTNIEQTHYSQLFYDMHQDCGLNSDGSPVNEQWDPESAKTIEKMRSWLSRLRKTCLHPEAGGRSRRALGKKQGPLRTVAQVLDVMIDQTESALRTEQRNVLMQRVKQGQIQENAKNREKSLELYTSAYKQTVEIVDQCETALKKALTQKKSTEQHEQVDLDDEDEMSDAEDMDDVESPTGWARQQLRLFLEIKHTCIFFMANIYYQMKSNQEQIQKDSDEFSVLEKKENDAYEEAKQIRAELLKGFVQKSNRKLRRISIKDSVPNLIEIPRMELDYNDYAGIESRKVYEKLYKLCEAMNEQAEQLESLRERMVVFLRQALVDEDEGVELHGNEYEDSTKHQDEMYAIMEVLRALYADRGEVVSGQDNTLVRGEVKNALRLAKEGGGPAPELMIQLLQEREFLRIDYNKQGSLRGIVAELRALLSSLQWIDAGDESIEVEAERRAEAEMQIVEKILQRTTKLLAGQNKVLSGLEQEVASFRTSMNDRLEYYKALQKISDAVAPYREEDVGKAVNEPQLRKAEGDETSAQNKCSALSAKSRYLLHIKAESTSEEAQRICVICQCEFEMGAITSCGHVFCKDDIRLWYAQSSYCPVCKTRLRAADFFDITYKPAEMAVQAEGPLSPDSSSPDKTAIGNSIYSDISVKQLNEIKDIEIGGPSWGSKVDTICRHLLWLRERDAGSKTLIFSQFQSVLHCLGQAFRQNGILYSSCDTKGAIQDFKMNPAIEVFLLHARAYSAGLNLVVASHVILCEPLINTALELQAIARVHRIGQHRATTVWMYLIANTVEESVYNISVQRRLAHMKKKTPASSRSGTQTPAWLQESAIDAANSQELQAADLSKALAPSSSGGEMVDKKDLWQCLFGNVADRNDGGSGSGSGSGSGLDSLSADAAAVGADGEIGRFLRAEAAENRQGA